ncbi:MAG TPA: tetratricopeptide repeat protein [Anaeromyxobacteraceae bacterium]|nr:tetratricopeptide repeat protein [Anaeromyxobacteraceae bacterium]
MWGYGTRDVARLVGVSEGRVRAWVRAGVVSPRRGSRGELRFAFQDLVLLRAAAGLSDARVPARRLRRTLRRLREQLPDGRALASVAVAADGERVVVSDGRSRWHPESGQALFDFSVREVAAEVAPLLRRSPSSLDADGWFAWACDLEDGAPAEAREAYRRALLLDPGHAGAHLNLGRLVHESGDAPAAERHYRRALETRPGDQTALFNLGVALGDQGRLEEALLAYGRALVADPGMADAHLNAARLCERLGRRAEAIRHLRAAREANGVTD